MRQINFRAWEKTLNEMIPVDRIDFDKQMINTSGPWRFFKEIELMQYTGLKDKNGVEIYEGDVLEVTDLWRRYRVVVKFGEYLQDGSGGEYQGSKCVGFYGEAIHKDALDEDEFPIVREEMHTASILDYEDIVILGNVYEHSHLLEGETQ